MISDESAKTLAREVRQAIGIERTPAWIKGWVHEHIQKATDSTIRRLVDDRDALLSVAKRMRIAILDDAPPSSEWED